MINAFVDENALAALAELESNTVVAAKRNVRVEFIDVAPLTADTIYDGNNAEITIYVRDEFQSNETVALHGTATEGIVVADEGDEDTVRLSYSIAESVNKLLQEKGMLEDCDALDMNKQGVMFSVDNNGVITIKIVEGKKRPVLLCKVLFGAPQMVRPYSDEFMNQLALENMSMEELEKTASDGNADAMKQLAMAYLNGNDSVEKNPEKSYYWFVKCAEAGDDEAMFNVGLYLAKGFGTERDFAKAAE